MIREYALEPHLLSNWKDIRYFIEKFSVAQGRLISEFPRHWKKMVYEACDSCGDVERTRITEKLKNIGERLIRRGREYDPGKAWVTNAMESNVKLAFHAIIACNPVSSCNQLVTGEAIHDGHTLWQDERSWAVRREAGAMSDAAGVLLEISREIVFVDPYFKPTSRNYRQPLEKFLERLAKRLAGPPRRLEYHLGDGDKPPRRAVDFQQFESDCKNDLPRCVPMGMELTLVRWKQPSVHNRYILTERGVMEFGTGLDEGTSTGTQSDTVKLLDESVRTVLWNDYVQGQGSLVSAGDPKRLRILGQRRLD